MARGGKIGHKRKTKNKVQLEKRGSDESDEDYKVEEDEEICVSEDEYCSSLADDETEESLGEFEEEWVEKNVKKARTSRARKASQSRKKIGAVKPKKKKIASSEEEEVEEEEDEEEEEEEEYEEDEEEEEEYEEEEAEDYDEYCCSGATQRKQNKASHKEEEDDDIDSLYKQEDDEFVNEKPRKRSRISRKRSRVSRTATNEDSDAERPRKRDKVSYQEEKEDGDYDDSDDKDDEEFSPGSEVSKRSSRKPVKKWALRRKETSSLTNELRDENPPSRKKKTVRGRGGSGSGGGGRRKRRRRSRVNSDSDFVSSGSSDYEYTVSEEEREQVREASKFCTSLRNSTSLKIVKEDEPLLPSKRKGSVRKGKQKVVDMKVELGKQVCGICLSEEGKRTVRGVLNCCSHYFCFACIMEWSKVESRCPLCKQRFATISRTSQAAAGDNKLTDAVFPVPERDQVYQPSEEELRGYIDPYENVLCAECQQGGDDALMLLCDLCDSPAHTYCVGLGHEVPDGNWYCEGCRPTAIASSNPLNTMIHDDVGTNNMSHVGSSSSPVGSVRETFDLNEVYVPETPLMNQGSVYSQSPRHPIGMFRATSPTSGQGASTLRGRRRLQQQINQLRSNRSRQSDMSLFGSSLIGQDESQNAVMRAQNMYFQGRVPEYNNAPALYNSQVFSRRLSGLGGETLVNNQASTSAHHSFGGLNHQQLHPWNPTSNTVADATTLPYPFREGTVPSRTPQGHLHTQF